MIKTRFAPSPTGELHIGGARTALFNFLFARGAKGKFVLRIDDTDAERSSLAYEKQLMEDLQWLGLRWDEGPDMGLPVPYRQSERFAIYREWLERLQEKHVAYPCFCSEARLESLRLEQLAKGEPPRYDGACRKRSESERMQKIQNGERPCWRFALPERAITFKDEVKGELSFLPESMGDFVLSRSDGAPTYLFTTVIDDYLMEITHIIRGDEHLSNTARQQALFESLGWRSPVYAHIPMILSEDRQKLSKRTGSTPIREYREKGYRPEALDAYLSTLSWTPSNAVSLLSLEDMQKAFSLDRISSSTPIHDEMHLKYWQKEAIKQIDSEELLQEIKKREPRFENFDPEALNMLIEDFIKEYYTLPLLLVALQPLLSAPEVKIAESWLSDLAFNLKEVQNWNSSVLDQTLRIFMKERGLKGKDFFHPLRLALTGQDKGAALPLILQALGPEETLRRLTGGTNADQRGRLK